MLYAKDMNKYIRYAGIALLIIFLGWVLYDRHEQNEDVKAQLNKIDSARQSLEDSVNVIKTNTADRDERLRSSLQNSMETVDTLNASLKKVNASSDAINAQIENQKQTINDLWSNK